MKKNLILLLAVIALSVISLNAKTEKHVKKKEKAPVEKKEKVYVLDDFDMLRKDCLNGDANKCFIVAVLLAKGDKHERPDNYEAVKYFKLACKKGSAAGCIKMSQCHQEGMAVPKNKNATKKYLKLACKLGSEEACFKINKQDTGL